MPSVKFSSPFAFSHPEAKDRIGRAPLLCVCTRRDTPAGLRMLPINGDSAAHCAAHFAPTPPSLQKIASTAQSPAVSGRPFRRTMAVTVAKSTLIGGASLQENLLKRFAWKSISRFWKYARGHAGDSLESLPVACRITKCRFGGWVSRAYMTIESSVRLYPRSSEPGSLPTSNLRRWRSPNSNLPALPRS